MELLAKQLTKLRDSLEREEEWKPFVPMQNEMSQEKYDELVNTEGVRELSEEEVKEILARDYGFEAKSIRIIPRISQYEINRHNVLRCTGIVDRKPLYVSPTQNYIRFLYEAPYVEYECQNGVFVQILQ